MHGTLSRLPGSGRHFKLTPDILAIIEEQMRVDDETTALNDQSVHMSMCVMSTAHVILADKSTFGGILFSST